MSPAWRIRLPKLEVIPRRGQPLEPSIPNAIRPRIAGGCRWQPGIIPSRLLRVKHNAGYLTPLLANIVEFV